MRSALRRTKKKSPSQDRSYSKDGLQAYLQTIRHYPILDREEEQKLALQFLENKDESIAVRLANSNLRLVVKIAHEYRSPQNHLLDLIQEGNLGLIYAVQRFDPERKVRLSSYAQWWIRAYILKYLMDNHRMVKVGTTQAQRKLYYNLNKMRDHLINQGIEPTTEALAAHLSVKERDVSEMSLRLNQGEIQLNAPVGDESGTERGDLIPSQAPLQDEIIAEHQFSQLFKNELKSFQAGLQGRDAMIWSERLISEKPLTLRELAGRFGVSRERVRQLEARIVNKLRDFVLKNLAPPTSGMLA